MIPNWTDTGLLERLRSSSHNPCRLGKSGMILPPMAWGMWRIRGSDVRRAQELVETALEAGLALFDTADVYGPDNGEAFGAAETLLGRVLAGAPPLRDAFVLATKGGIEIGSPYNSSASHLVQACEASLKRLNIECVDLYQIHRPDTLTHPAETAQALDALRQAGKIREAGVSNHSPSQVSALQAHLPFPLASVQPELSALATAALHDGVLDQAMELDLTVLAWSPLAGGRLLLRDGEQAIAVANALATVAEQSGVSLGVAAFAWVMAHPARPIPIVGSQSVSRIREAADALKVSFTRAQWYGVLQASMGEKLP